MSGAAVNQSMQSRRERALRMVLQFLQEEGLEDAHRTLQIESGLEALEEAAGPAQLYQCIDAFDEAALRRGARPEAEAERKLRDRLLAKSGDERLIARQRAALSELHTGNIVACRFAPTQPWVVTGGVDRSVRITDYESGVQVCQLSGVFPAPVLAVDVNPAHPELLAVSCMDGAHLIVDHAARRVVQQWKDHSKYVTRVRWSRNGRLLITASHDHSAKLYGLVNDAGGEPTWRRLHEFVFCGAVEAVEWLGDAPLCVVSARDDHRLHVIDVAAMREAAAHNMNATGDAHVSFTAMDLAASPDASLLLVATDRHRCLLMQANSPLQVRNFYGVNNDSYSNPRVAWGIAGHHVYCTSQDQHSVAAFDVASERLVHRLTGHSKTVRDMQRHPSRELLATASYDGTVRIWSP